jgi:hypothetical protein
MNNVLIGAEGIDGANFLVACLSMNNKVYFNNYSVNEKVEFFFNGMTNIKKENGLPIWSDVSMLFNDCARSKSGIRFSTYQSKKIYESVKDNLSDKVLINKVQLPLFWPLINVIEKNPEDPLVKLFESKYFIGLVNPNLFVSLRTVLGNSELDFMTVQEFGLLSEELQKIIKEKYQSNIEQLFKCDGISTNLVKFSTTIQHRWNMHNMKCDLDCLQYAYPEIKNKEKIGDLYKKSNELIKNKITHEWDCNWFLSEDETIENLKFLYSEFELGKLDQKLISEMYKVWIDRIDHIKKSHIKEFEVAINNFTFVNED